MTMATRSLRERALLAYQQREAEREAERTGNLPTGRMLVLPAATLGRS